MLQDEVFAQGEGDNWFKRNQKALEDSARFDWPLRLIERQEPGVKQSFVKIVELGCSSGWRLSRLKSLAPQAELSGCDASAQAIAHGRQIYPGLELRQARLDQLPWDKPFDLVIVSFVLHWIDRTTLSRSIAEIDRLVKDGGYLLLSDFEPAAPSRRRYHHRSELELYTFKQDYAKVFEALGLYQTADRVSFDHSRPESTEAIPPGSRAFCALLKKSWRSYYEEERE